MRYSLQPTAYSLLLTAYYLLLTAYCYAQDTDIRSVQCFVGNNELSDPVMELNGNERLMLWFDDLNEKRSSLSYIIVHCDANWREDGLFISDYMDGFEDNYLRDYALSFQTRVNYIHYNLQLPNEDVRLKASGNYLIKIYETDRSKPVLVQRFSLYERGKTGITLRTRGPMITGERCLQHLEFSVQHQMLPVRDAYTELKVRVTQNGIPVPGVELPQPSFIDRGVVSYTLADKNWYPGGNEYRFFDTRTLDFGAQGVQQVRYDNQGYPYALLNVDGPRDEQPYTFYNDLNGKFRIDAYRMRNRQTDAEYVITAFTLAEEELPGDLYVFGQLSDWSLRPDFKMTYNADREVYELTVPLKQGYYNYRYLFVDRNGNIEPKAIEGCFAETENYYTVWIYYRSTHDRYDRLVGIHTLGTL
ncbi:MAG: DUF5103 domain-containing protein [Prevotellaceae bacterium]|jgi:hypothetical protein|nr:DUF5103 domain-containing protein [Prevotellaceae bacterium]